jgi:predicted metal-dependent phosphoesterase TrpH
MTEKYDLHCHSTASDGALSPTEVVQRAHEHGVTVLALTDHDTTDGLQEAARAAEALGMRLVNGIELSTSYRNQCLHIIGLNIDPCQADLMQGVASQQSIRYLRAKQISEKLEKKNIFGAFEFVTKMAGNAEITRTHFADFLLENQYVNTQQEAFDRYLGQGKSAYVPTIWASLDEVVSWITLSGGVAVLAHPLRYNLSVKWLDSMLSVFAELGGKGIEVVNGRGTPEEIQVSRKLADKYQLYASVGSDFHSPDHQWLELGKLVELPLGIPPVWELF